MEKFHYVSIPFSYFVNLNSSQEALREAAVRRCFSKKMFLKIFAIFTGSICVIQHWFFPENIANFLRAHVFIKHPWWSLLDLIHV